MLKAVTLSTISWWPTMKRAESFHTPKALPGAYSSELFPSYIAAI